jgi:hypothetical protein
MTIQATRAEIAVEPLDTSVRRPGPAGTVEAATQPAVEAPSAPEPPRSKPLVLTVPLYSIPCVVCACPAVEMDTCGSWSRTWHQLSTRTTPGRYCDVGVRPVQGGAT